MTDIETTPWNGEPDNLVQVSADFEKIQKLREQGLKWRTHAEMLDRDVDPHVLAASPFYALSHVLGTFVLSPLLHRFADGKLMDAWLLEEQYASTEAPIS